MQNRLQAERRYYAGKLNEHTLKGVGERDMMQIMANRNLPQIKNDDSLDIIETRGKGRYNAYQQSYKGTGLGKHKTYIHTPSDHLWKLREARKKYRAMLNAYIVAGGNANRFDFLFKDKYPKAWRLIIDNQNEFRGESTPDVVAAKAELKAEVRKKLVKLPAYLLTPAK